MAYEGYLKLTGAKAGWIKGESRDKAHADWIEIESFSWGGIAPRDTATGQASGKRQYQPFRFVAQSDTSLVPSLTAFATNEELTEAIIAVRKQGASFDYLTAMFQKSSYGGFDFAFGGEPGTIEFTLLFDMVQVTHTAENADGSAGKQTIFQDSWSTLQL